jgi:hypothetical protein
MFGNYKIYYSIILILTLLIGCNNSIEKLPQKKVVLSLPPVENNPRNSEGDFILLNDGRLLFIYTHFTGGSDDDAAAYLAGRISEDEGITWSEKDIVILKNEGGMNIMSVSLLRLNNGEIALFYLRKNSKIDCVPVMRISSDEARTWSDPKVCVDSTGYYVMNNDRAVQLENGRIILPLALHNTPETNKWHPGRLFCFYSDDNGASWSRSSEIANPENVTSQEPGLVQLSDGTLFLFCRTNMGVQYISYSKDSGVNWSDLSPGNIKSPLSPASIERIPETEDLLLVWNNNFEGGKSGGRRTPLNIALSKDEGLTWENMKTLESDPNGWYCYTAIQFFNEHLLLAHCAGDRIKYGGLETTQLYLLSYDWIYSPPFPDPYLEEDSTGLVKLKIKEEDCKIYYSLDGSLPDSENGILFTAPVKIYRTSLIQYQAFGKDDEKSKIIQNYVGAGIYQKPALVDTVLDSNLNYSLYKCAINSIDQISESDLIYKGKAKKIDVSLTSMKDNFAIIFDGYL